MPETDKEAGDLGAETEEGKLLSLALRGEVYIVLEKVEGGGLCGTTHLGHVISLIVLPHDS